MPSSLSSVYVSPARWEVRNTCDEHPNEFVEIKLCKFNPDDEDPSKGVRLGFFVDSDEFAGEHPFIIDLNHADVETLVAALIALLLE